MFGLEPDMPESEYEPSGDYRDILSEIPSYDDMGVSLSMNRCKKKLENHGIRLTRVNKWTKINDAGVSAERCTDCGGFLTEDGGCNNPKCGGGTDTADTDSKESTESIDDTDSSDSTEYSATGANPNLPGFTQKNLDKHWGSGGKHDHSKQYPNFTKEQYAQRAHDLVRSPVGEGVEGYAATHGKFKGSVVRYDTSTNDWVRATSNGITTMFKPRNNSAYFEHIAGMETRG
jgi:hypothetical protein